jgi:hypothetical protein
MQLRWDVTFCKPMNALLSFIEEYPTWAGRSEGMGGEFNPSFS